VLALDKQRMVRKVGISAFLNSSVLCITWYIMHYGTIAIAHPSYAVQIHNVRYNFIYDMATTHTTTAPD